MQFKEVRYKINIPRTVIKIKSCYRNKTAFVPVTTFWFSAVKSIIIILTSIKKDSFLEPNSMARVVLNFIAQSLRLTHDLKAHTYQHSRVKMYQTFWNFCKITTTTKFAGG